MFIVPCRKQCSSERPAFRFRRHLRAGFVLEHVYVVSSSVGLGYACLGVIATIIIFPNSSLLLTVHFVGQTRNVFSLYFCFISSCYFSCLMMRLVLDLERSSNLGIFPSVSYSTQPQEHPWFSLVVTCAVSSAPIFCFYDAE